MALPVSSPKVMLPVDWIFTSPPSPPFPPSAWLSGSLGSVFSALPPSPASCPSTTMFSLSWMSPSQRRVQVNPSRPWPAAVVASVRGMRLAGLGVKLWLFTAHSPAAAAAVTGGAEAAKSAWKSASVRSGLLVMSTSPDDSVVPPSRVMAPAETMVSSGPAPSGSSAQAWRRRR